MKVEAIRHGLVCMENAFGRYKAAHREVMNQLMLEVEKQIVGEDEAAFTQVIEEDEESNDIGELYGEAMTAPKIENLSCYSSGRKGRNGGSDRKP